MIRVKPTDNYPGSSMLWCELMTGYVASLVSVHGWAVVIEAEVRRGWHIRGAFPTAALAEGYVAGCWEPSERAGLVIVAS